MKPSGRGMMLIGRRGGRMLRGSWRLLLLLRGSWRLLLLLRLRLRLLRDANAYGMSTMAIYRIS
jgi:hypothetical protein